MREQIQRCERTPFGRTEREVNRKRTPRHFSSGGRWSIWGVTSRSVTLRRTWVLFNITIMLTSPLSAVRKCPRLFFARCETLAARSMLNPYICAPFQKYKTLDGGARRCGVNERSLSPTKMFGTYASKRIYLCAIFGRGHHHHGSWIIILPIFQA